MQVYIEGELTNIFKNRDYEDKAGKWQLQFMSKRDLGDGLGQQLVLEKISIPDEMYPMYKDKIGEEVKVPVGVVVTGPDSRNHKAIFYGI